MDKKACLTKSKMFLKMAECDFAVLKIIKISKCILTAVFFLNAAAFAVTTLLAVKKS